jgi:Crp-like helix-turn-helix domain
VRHRTDGHHKVGEIACGNPQTWCSMSSVPENFGPTRNHLLAELSSEDYERLLPHLRPVKLSLGNFVGDTNGHFGCAYFPTTCVVSLICEMENGATSEVALTGNDGVVGISLFLGGNTATSRGVVGLGGEALQMDARVVKDQFMRGGTFQRILLRYTEALITQISLTAACNRMHTLEKRLCRWLLLIHDRTTCDELVMTQEFIANMLGGRRETVTVAAGRLQDAGLIHYTRGRLKIINRKGLESTVCECYKSFHGESYRVPPETNTGPRHCLSESPYRTRLSNVLS